MLLFLNADFNLEKERSGLDEQGLKIAENQENSQKNRRKLAESTRGMPNSILPICNLIPDAINHLIWSRHQNYIVI